MDIKNSVKENIVKLQKLSDKQKKILLWSVVAVLAIIMGYFWIRSVADKLNQIKLP